MVAATYPDIELLTYVLVWFQSKVKPKYFPPSPIDWTFEVIMYCVDKIVGIIKTFVFDSKIINEKGKNSGASLIFP